MNPLPDRCPERPSRWGRCADETSSHRPVDAGFEACAGGQALGNLGRRAALFWVRVTDTGKASFFIMRRANGDPKPVRVVLGSYPAISLSDARERARQALVELSAGNSPVRQKAAQRAAEVHHAQSTVEAVAEDFIPRHIAKKRTAVVVTQLIRREIVSRWATRPIGDITRGDILRMLEQIRITARARRGRPGFIRGGFSVGHSTAIPTG